MLYDVHIEPDGKKQVKGLLSFEVTMMPKPHIFGLNKSLTVHSLKTTFRSQNLQEHKAGRGKKEGRQERKKEGREGKRKGERE